MSPVHVAPFRIPGPVNESPCRGCPKAANGCAFAFKAGPPADSCPLSRKMLGLPK